MVVAMSALALLHAVLFATVCAAAHFGAAEEMTANCVARRALLNA